jgi:hypothetical protein
VQARLSSLSRSNSAGSQHGVASNGRVSLLPGSTASLISESQGVDISTALKILKEVRKSASPQDLDALRKSTTVFMFLCAVLAPPCPVRCCYLATST